MFNFRKFSLVAVIFAAFVGFGYTAAAPWKFPEAVKMKALEFYGATGTNIITVKDGLASAFLIEDSAGNDQLKLDTTANTVTVTPNTTVAGTLTSTGAFTASSTAATGALTVTGAASATTTVTAGTGLTVTTGGVTLSGATGATQFSVPNALANAMTIESSDGADLIKFDTTTDALTLTPPTTITGAATLSSTLGVTGASTLTGGATLGAGNAITASYTGSAVIDFASQNATCVDSTAITVTGAAVNDTCMVGYVGVTDADGSFTCYVGSTNNVYVRFCAPVTYDPASLTYYVRTFR